MALPMSSQNISKVNNKPKAITSINSKGDTLVSFMLKDAKTILSDLFDYKIVDSLLIEYKIKDSLNNRKIELLVNDIRQLQIQSNNKDLQISNLNSIIDNKEQIALLDKDIIKKQKKEIRKQKVLKVVFMVTSVTLPIIVLLAAFK
jgi:hypothetical protein